MQIEIHKSKTKLTKSIINQMRPTGLLSLKFGKVLGYLINVKKDCYKCLLIEFHEEFFIESIDWKKGDTTVYRKIGKWTRTKQFNSQVICNEWWDALNVAKEKATTQIYI